MDIKQEKISDTQINVMVCVLPDELKDATESIVKTLMKTVKVKGYRPGHVPANVVAGLYRQDILAEATTRLVQNATTEAFKDRSLRTATNPKLMPEFSPSENKRYLGKIDLDGSLKFGISVDIVGEIVIGDLSSLTIHHEAMEKDEWIQSKLEEQSVLFGTRDAVSRPSISGDEIVCEYEAADIATGGVLGSDAYARIGIGSGAMPETFEQGLIGLIQGAKFEFDVAFPPFHFKSELGGKTVKVRGQVLEVNAVVPHEMNDDLAKVAGYGSLEEMRSANETMWQEQHAEGLKAKKLSLAMDELFKANPFSVPDSLVEQEIEKLKVRMNLDLDAERMRELLWDLATRNVQTALMLDQIYNSSENIHLTADELLEEANKEAIHRSMGDGATLLQFLRKTGQYEAFMMYFEQRKAVEHVLATVNFEK